ncbi:MAG: 50S ribosomal protein L25 [Deltaproteobacteria bacterium]
MLQFEVDAQMRKNFGKGAARQLRRAGKTPAVLYGCGIGNMPLEVDTKPFTKTLLNIHGQNAVLSLKIKGAKEKKVHHVLLKEVQVDPVKDSLVHADFLEIDLEKQMTLAVPVKFVGKAKGVDMGGELHISHNSILLRGKVLDIPNDITVNVSGLELGAKTTCNEIELPAGVTLAEDSDTVLALVQGASAKPAEEEIKEEIKEEE